MKKVIAVVLAIIMVFSLAACGGEKKAEKYCFNCGKGISKNVSFCEHCGANVKDNGNDSGDASSDDASNDDQFSNIPNTNKPSTNKPSTNSGYTNNSPHTHSFGKATCTSPAKCSCGATSGSALGHAYSSGSCSRCGAKDNNYAKPVLVYQDSKVKIYYKEFTSKGVVFEVENLTNVNITIQANSVSLNYRSTDDIIMSDNVAPYSVGDVIAQCSISNVGTVGIVSGQLRIIDFDRSFSTYTATFQNVQVNKNVSVSKPVVSGSLLYSDAKVKIYFKKVTDDGVVFTIDNLTNINITIQADSVSINKRSTDDIIMSDNVAPYSVGDVIAQCDDFSSVGTVSLVGGQLRIIDFDRSFSTYKASFYNIAV